jgi:hypothetical protein
MQARPAQSPLELRFQRGPQNEMGHRVQIASLRDLRQVLQLCVNVIRSVVLSIIGVAPAIRWFTQTVSLVGESFNDRVAVPKPP